MKGILRKSLEKFDGTPELCSHPSSDVLSSEGEKYTRPSFSVICSKSEIFGCGTSLWY